MDRLLDLNAVVSTEDKNLEYSSTSVEIGPSPSRNEVKEGESFSEIDSEAGKIDKTSEQILSEFYVFLDQIQAHIRVIQTDAAILAVKHSEKLQTVDLDNASYISKEIHELTGNINEKIKCVKNDLEMMKKGTQALSTTEESVHANAAVIKIQENQHSYLLRNFMTAVTQYQQIQGDAKKQFRDQTERRIRIQYTNEDGSTIDDTRARELAQEVIDYGTENAIFQQSADTLMMIMETRNDIHNIEHSMRELTQLFTDLAVLVSDQGDIMDQILSNVQNSNKYVEKGRSELKAAKKHAKSSRSKLCILIVGVAIIFGILLAVILGYTLPIKGA
eukprot:Tbor_TRINITY_DN5881_c6_g1::TRINITY_DN5881_c6_g1_i1::g.5996::m.5996/K08486/STX1B_2_3; syntaxin 1B/2/3